jgi:uncharacterized protein YggE
MNRVSRRIITLVMVLFLWPLAACATAEKPPQTITVTGSGQVNAQPALPS